jgi:hypothetical protein
MDQSVLDTLDQKLAPAAQSPDVRAILADVRRAVAMHLQHAQDLLRDMQETP